MSEIRVTYSGLIAFLVALVGIITGTIFVVIVTRRLSPEDFGLWTLIGSLVSYVTIIEPILTYWVTRQIARGESIGKTALAVDGLMAIIGFTIYFILAAYLSSSLHYDFFVLILASLLIPISFVNNLLNSICAGFKPQSISYGILAFEASKIPLGIIFVILIPLGINGAIITTIGAGLAKIIMMFLMSKEKLSGPIIRQSIRFWFRMSWLTLYMSIHGLVFKLDVLIFSVLMSSLTSLALWGAASSPANFVAYADRISQGLFPKLLTVRKNKVAEENLKRTMYFAIPILGAVIVFAKPALHVLNPLYIEGTYVVVVLAIRSLINVITGFYLNLLESYEDVDIDKEASFKLYVKSKLFLVPTLWLFLSISYVVALAIFLISFHMENMTNSLTVLIWAIILLMVTIPFMTYGIITARRKFGITFPYKDTLKYICITILVSAVIYLISEKTLTYEKSIWIFLPEIVPIVAFGGVMYFGITYVLDKSARSLFNSIFKEIFKKEHSN